MEFAFSHGGRKPRRADDSCTNRNHYARNQTNLNRRSRRRDRIGRSLQTRRLHPLFRVRLRKHFPSKARTRFGGGKLRLSKRFMWIGRGLRRNEVGRPILAAAPLGHLAFQSGELWSPGLKR